jgi:hypothetical protein
MSHPQGFGHIEHVDQSCVFCIYKCVCNYDFYIDDVIRLEKMSSYWSLSFSILSLLFDEIGLIECLLTSITMKKNLTWQDVSSLSLWRECEHKSMSYVQAQFVPFQMTFRLFGLH